MSGSPPVSLLITHHSLLSFSLSWLFLQKIRFILEELGGEMKSHSPKFLEVVKDAKKRVREITVDDVKQKMDRGENFYLVDVREESEWNQDHLPGAIHIGKGVIERDIETRIPDSGAEIVLYCGGGFRSALAADILQRMGYKKVISMDGGYSGWKKAGYSLEKG
jgi:rhodanese-related sulfurtransferase